MLTVFAAMALIALAPANAVSSGAGCGHASWLGSCEVQNGGQSITIEASRGGESGGGGTRTEQNWFPSEREYPEFVPVDELPAPIRILPDGEISEEGYQATCEFYWLCQEFEPIPVEPEPEAETPDVTTATIDDVASYAPGPPALTGEPGGMGVVGMPTNFVVDADVHTVDGEIFDISVTVRFTPVGYTFHYGDGTSRESSSPGVSWADTDAPQFTATDTSHAYASPGTYAASVDITYAAEGDAGAGWFPIAGTLELSTPSTSIRIVEVETALVERTCVEDPGGVGC
jgi:hypothetical protein